MLPPAIALFARTPIRGQVKTRLGSLLTPEQALELHVACIQDLCEKLAPLRNSFQIYVYQTEPGNLPQVCRSFESRLQIRGDLGQRLEAAAQVLFEAGHESVVFLGTDTPHLDAKLIVQSIDLLQQCDVAIGPSEDGGYYLLALKKPCSALFHDIQWGSEKVLLETTQRLDRQQIPFRLLEQNFDLDRPEDLKRLLQSPARALAPRTHALLRKLKI
jgi:hypothetical protein